MSEYYNGDFQNGQEMNHQSSAYTYIPTEPIGPAEIKKPEKKRKKKGSGAGTDDVFS